MTIKSIKKFFCACLVGCAVSTAFSSCSDEPDSEYFYTFTGEMMSDYLKNRPELYSDFTYIVEKANLMDLLATYGHYTCFVPNNEAIKNYLREHGKSSVRDLSDADCDTIARTHLIPNMYTTFEMDQDRLPTANMMGRYIATEADEVDGHPVIKLEGTAYIYFEQQNDSVENGIMQPINMVIEKSNSYIADILRDNREKIGLFYDALVATKVYDEILLVDDPDWDPKAHEKYYYRSHTWSEVAWVPDTKKYGFTLFVEPDSLFHAKFQEYKDKGASQIDLSAPDLKNLYELAAFIYKDVFPEDVGKDGWKFENLTDSINPLHRFMQYHVMTRYVAGTSDLTALVMHSGAINESFGFDSRITNPVEWFQTLLPHKMIKVEMLTMNKDSKGNDCRGADADKVGERFLNRRYAFPKYKERGCMVDATVETSPVHDALNGHYFYIDDILAFSKEVRDIVHNDRIRMDFSTIFPEIMTNDMRLKGNPWADDSNSTPDDSSTPKNGRNFYFPLGYLDGVTFNSTCHFVMRRPHVGFWSWQGDEWNIFGDYDLTFRIPPVPFSGEWQLRLGFCAIETRGVMQVYFDGVPRGIPLDMTKYLDSELYIGNRFEFDESSAKYDAMSIEDKAEEQKLLRNLGAYRAGRSTYHFGGSERLYFVGNNRTYRRILCQTTIDATKDHYLRFRVASDGKQGNNNEFMLDYFEMVPKSVYGVDGDAAMEDDL